MEKVYDPDRLNSMPKGSQNTHRKITPMEEMDTPKEITQKQWNFLLAVTASQVISYASVIVTRLDDYEIELDAHEEVELAENGEVVSRIADTAKKLLGRNSGLELLACLLDALEITHYLNAKYLEKCECSNCQEVERAYDLGKQMIQTLASVEITAE